ncbi:PAN 1 domain containing protein [Trichuris trichiura]|uniref:PAN 1 domain containing protein n=1 Tax=Trichuris trichiura TaxID=36087 RepID=A0A077ZB27_TRITR|nr:PAN 1 domain containing protein [Trichuris trichiura]
MMILLMLTIGYCSLNYLLLLLFILSCVLRIGASLYKPVCQCRIWFVSALGESECLHDWWFERIPNKQIAVASLFTLSAIVGRSVEECLSECAKRAHTCKSVQYTKTSKECLLLSASRATVSQPNGIFIGASDTDLYENGCSQWPAIASKMKCSFRTGYGLTVPALYDERRTEVASSQQCQQLCLSSSRHLCTAYAYVTTSRVCYLIHTGDSMEERRVFMQRSTMRDQVHLGRLENWHNAFVFKCSQLIIVVRMNCEAQHMRVDVEILKLVNGEVTSVKDPNRCRIRMINSWTATSMAFRTRYKVASCKFICIFASSLSLDMAPQKFRVTDLVATDLRSGNDLLLYDNNGFVGQCMRFFAFFL